MVYKKHVYRSFTLLLFLLIGWGFCQLEALASLPKPWQIGFQPAASPTMEGITHLHNLLLIIITIIGLFVFALLGYVIWRFRDSVHPVPTTVTHNTTLEIIWTLIPVLILILIAVPSLKLLFFTDRITNADITVKAIGHQWYWTYQYPEHDITFDSMMIKTPDLKPGQLRLLEVDNRILVPVGKAVRLLVTSEDVLHSFAVPSLGVKKDAVPGRLNETWFKIEKEGVYYGQCSELCGKDHGFMPIAVEAVPQAQYDAWIKSKEKPKPPAQAAPAQPAPAQPATPQASAHQMPSPTQPVTKGSTPTKEAHSPVDSQKTPPKNNPVS